MVKNCCAWFMVPLSETLLNATKWPSLLGISWLVIGLRTKLGGILIQSNSIIFNIVKCFSLLSYNIYSRDSGIDYNISLRIRQLIHMYHIHHTSDNAELLRLKEYSIWSFHIDHKDPWLYYYRPVWASHRAVLNYDILSVMLRHSRHWEAT